MDGYWEVKELMQKEGEGCTRQCSDMCLDILLENIGCDNECNVPECEYDNGMCMSNDNS